MENLNNTNNNEFNELDDIRQQINAIKDKVDEQGHLNEALVKKIIQKKMKGVHRIIMLMAIIGLLCIPLYIWIKYEMNLSWYFVIFTIVMMLGGITVDYFINRMDITHMGDDMVETARKLTQMKTNRSRATKIEICFAILWLLWFCFEKYMSDINVMGSHSAIVSVVILFVVSVIITTVVGYPIFQKMQRANDEMINQINELTHEQ